MILRIRIKITILPKIISRNIENARENDYFLSSEEAMTLGLSLSAHLPKR
jgi:hypothetical protein